MYEKMKWSVYPGDPNMPTNTSPRCYKTRKHTTLHQRKNCRGKWVNMPSYKPFNLLLEFQEPTVWGLLDNPASLSLPLLISKNSPTQHEVCRKCCINSELWAAQMSIEWTHLLTGTWTFWIRQKKATTNLATKKTGKWYTSHFISYHYPESDLKDLGL